MISKAPLPHLDLFDGGPGNLKEKWGKRDSELWPRRAAGEPQSLVGVGTQEQVPRGLETEQPWRTDETREEKGWKVGGQQSKGAFQSVHSAAFLYATGSPPWQGP